MKPRTWKTFEEFKAMIDRVVKENDRIVREATLQTVKKKGLESVPRPPFNTSEGE